MRHSLVFAFCLIVVVASYGISRSSAPSPDDAQAEPAWSAAPSFFGVTLGEHSSDVRARLGKPELEVTTNHGPTWAYGIVRDTAWLVLLFQQDKVASVNVLPQAGHVVRLRDPFGVSTDDALSRLTTIRGSATRLEGPNIYYYGQSDQPGWMYGGWNDRVLSIGLTTGETNIPALIIDWRRDGAIPERAIILHTGSNVSTGSEELAKLNETECEDTGTWTLISRAKVSYAGATLDAVRVHCSVAFLQRVFYFQVGK